MQIFYSDKFKKNFQRLPLNIQIRFRERLSVFVNNPTNPLLKLHPLKGNLAGIWAFSVTGDYRVIYLKIDPDSIELVDIGTHNQVYR